MSKNPFPNPFPAPTAQLSYDYNFALPLPGSVADDSIAQEFVTGINPNAVTIFGCLYVVDPSVSGQIATGQNQGLQGIKAPTSSGDVTAGVIGIAVRTGAIEARRDTQPPSYDVSNPANLMRMGRIWTASEVDVVKHDPVYVRVTANGALNTLGALRNDSDGGNAVLVSGAKWFDTATQGAAARVECNFLGL